MLRCDVQLNSRQYSWSQIRVQNRWRCRAVVQSAATRTCRRCKVIQPVLVDAEFYYQYLSTLQGDTTSTCRRCRVLPPVLVDAEFYYQYLSTLQSAATSTDACNNTDEERFGYCLLLTRDVTQPCWRGNTSLQLTGWWRRCFSVAWVRSRYLEIAYRRCERCFTVLVTWKHVFTTYRNDGNVT